MTDIYTPVVTHEYIEDGVVVRDLIDAPPDLDIPIWVSYAPVNYVVAAQTLLSHLEGIDIKLADVGSGSVAWTDVTGKPTFHAVATSGDYDDLINKPAAPGSGDFVDLVSAQSPDGIKSWQNYAGFGMTPVNGMYDYITSISSLTNIGIFRVGNNLSSGDFYFNKTRGATPSTHVIVQDVDYLGWIGATGSDGVNWNHESAGIGFRVHGTPAVGSVPGAIEFWTAAAGDQWSTLRLKIYSDGTADFQDNAILTTGTITGDVAWSNISTAPTTLAGYGITDAAPSSHVGGNIHIDWSVTGAEDIHADRYTDTVYVHPTTAGNIHLPAGGSSGQIIEWASAGTGQWVTPTTGITDHTALSNIGTNTHAQIDTHIALVNAHRDWTADQGATNIHTGNYVNTTYDSSDFIDLTSAQTAAGIKTFSASNLNQIATGTPIFTVKTSAASSQDSVFRLGGARTASSTSDIAKIEFMNIDNSRAEIVMRDPAASSAANDGSLIIRTYDNGVAQDAVVFNAAGDANFQANAITTTGAISGVNVTSGVDPGHTHSGYSSGTHTHTFNSLTSKTSGTGNYQTTGDFIADNFEATGLGPNSTPGTDDAYVGGYGLMGSRALFYISNVAGAVLLNHTGTHGTNTKLATSATGITVTGDVAATTIGGITQANLLDKSATETVSGVWNFSHADGLGVDRGIYSTYLSGTHTTAYGATIYGMGKAYTGSVAAGNSYAPTGVYGLSYLRAANPSADANVGEGAYVFVNGAYKGGMGSSGLESVGPVKGTQLVSTLATGTSPIIVASTTKVTNLNADLLDGANLSSTAGNSTVVQRTSSGYIYANYFNGSGSFSTTGAATGMGRFIGNNGTDTFARSYTSAAARISLGYIFEKHVTIENPTSGDDVTWFFTNRAITATEIRLVAVGSSVSSVITIRHSTDRSAVGTIVDANTVTSTTTGHDVTAISDATIPANSFVWVEVGTTSGTVTNVHVTMIGTID